MIIIFDLITKYGDIIIHHGKNNDRAYLLSVGDSDIDFVYEKLEKLAKQNNYGKIIVKLPYKSIDKFIKNGFVIEANIPKYYYGLEDAVFLCKYYNEKRKVDEEKFKCDDIIKISKIKAQKGKNIKLDTSFICCKATIADVSSMTELYRKIFKTYPFPIHNEEYILKTMNENVIYYGVWEKTKLIALSSIEMDIKNNAAEMTDFAVLEEYRGNNIAYALLAKMEEKSFKLGIKTVFTIARAKSPGMNITFARSGYDYGGTLVNNTNISGQIESMNVWYKSLK